MVPVRVPQMLLVAEARGAQVVVGALNARVPCPVDGVPVAAVTNAVSVAKSDTTGTVSGSSG
jgi:hypothetical protein